MMLSYLFSNVDNMGKKVRACCVGRSRFVDSCYIKISFSDL